MVEEFEIVPESPSETQGVVEGVNSPSPSAYPGYSNKFSFPTDDVLDKFFRLVQVSLLIFTSCFH